MTGPFVEFGQYFFRYRSKYLLQIVDRIFRQFLMSVVLFQNNQCTALMLAAQYGHLNVTQLLLDWGSNRDARDVCYILFPQFGRLSHKQINRNPCSNTSKKTFLFILHE